MTKQSYKKSKTISGDEWIRQNFEWLIDHFPGQYVVVAEGEPFIGTDVVELEQQAQKRHPGIMTTGMPIPRPEALKNFLL